MSQGIDITLQAHTEEAAQKLSGFFSHLDGTLQRTSNLGHMLQRIGAQFAAVFSVGRLLQGVNEVIRLAETMGKLTEQTGFAIESINGLKEQAEALGVPFEALAGSLGRFSERVDQAVRQGGAAAQVFLQLGIRLGDTDGRLRSLDSLLSDVAERFSRMPDGPHKTAAAMELFGRAGRDLIPILNQGAAAMDDLRQSQDGVTSGMAQDARSLNAAMRQMGNLVEGLFIRFAKDLLPALVQVARAMAEAGAATSGASAELRAFADLCRAVIVALDLMLTNLRTLTIYIAHSAVGAWEIFNAQIRAGVELAGLWWDSMKAVWELMGSLVNRAGTLGPALSAALRGNWTEASALAAGAVAPDLEAGLKRVQENMLKASGVVASTAKRDFDLVKGLAAGTADEVVATWANFWERAQAVWGAGGSGGGSVAPDQGAAGGSPMGDLREVEALVRAIDKVYRDASRSRIAALDAEEAEFHQSLEQQLQLGLMSTAQFEAQRTRLQEAYSAKRRAIEREEQDALLAGKLSELQSYRQLVESDVFATRLEKRDQVLEALRKENQLLAENIQLHRARAKDRTLTDEARQDAERRLSELQQRQSATQREIEAASAAGTWRGEWSRMLTELGDAWGSWAKQGAEAFRSVYGAAIDAISNGITGLIMRTKSWGEALREIGTSILSTVINAIVRMFVTWIVNMTVLKLLQKLFHRESNVQATQSAAAWAPAAMLAATASYGTTAAVGTASVIAGMAVTAAFAAGLSAAGFMGGGFTGRGARGEVAGVVHRGEYVFSAPAVDRIGVGRLEEMHSGAAVGPASGFGGGRSEGTRINVAVLNDESRIANWARSQEGEAHVVDIVRRNWHQLT